MSVVIEAEPVPLVRLDNGTIRIEGTRIPLERVVYSWLMGESPEGIVESFDSLKLADVYAVISYYLNHKAEVETYMREREAEGERIRTEMEKLFPPEGLRARLLARREAQEKAEREGKQR
ncbi:MAG: DUF433 domain-containing protein [Acidobacteriota bacterium]|nr:DUF433 domain-containing protein [Acidobacteriota bacterium]